MEFQMRNKTFTHSMAAACAVLVAGSAASGSTNFTGNPTTSSGLVWNFAGNSLQSTNVIWAGGNTARSIDYYASHFTFTGTETESASMGSTSVGGTGWTVGDRVVAIGLVVTNGVWLNGETFMKFNPGGAGTYSAASSVGGSGASPSFTTNSVVGDYQLYGSINGNAEGNVTQFRYRTASGSGSSYPMQVGGALSGALMANPFNSFSEVGGTSVPGNGQFSSQTFLINVDYLARAGVTYGFSPNMIGNTIGKLFISSGLGEGSTPTDVLLTNVAVPAPGALALLGVAGLIGGRRRRA
ncbi:MAG: hypothetical protein EXS04_07250 [Phycisphaerales bacterium]|nr:hypothetical protein [Phycisphaerales bacterium]